MKHTPSWPLAALLIIAPALVVLLTQGSTRGNFIPKPDFCGTTSHGVVEVHRLESCRLIEHEDSGGCGDESGGVVGIGCHDKGAVATCNPDASCGPVYKIVGVDCPDEGQVAALYWQEQVYRHKTFVISPEQYLAAGDFLSIDTHWLRNPALNIAIDYEYWQGCMSYDISKVSSKYSICVDGNVYLVASEFNAPWNSHIACTCNDAGTTYRNMTVCTDFTCADDADAQSAARVCPEVDAPDGDEEWAAEQTEQ